MDILVFDHEYKGHHESFLKILINYAELNSQKNFVFVVNPGFDKLSEFKSSNIRFDFLSNRELDLLTKYGIINSFLLTLYLLKRSRKYKIKDVVLISLMKFLPGILLLSFSGIKIKGIIYNIYLYRYKISSFLKKAQDILIYTSLRMFSIFKYIYILDDCVASKILNNKFNTSKFHCLPDPIVFFEEKDLINIYTKYHISSDRRLFLHVGYLESRKGTLDLLEAISQIEDKKLDDKVFVIAGEVDVSIKVQFDYYKELFRENKSVIIIDHRIDDSLLHSFLKYSDYILLPYSNINQSSGVLQLAKGYSKMVVLMEGGYLQRSLVGYTSVIFLKEPRKFALVNFLINVKETKQNAETSPSKSNIFEFTQVLMEHNA